MEHRPLDQCLGADYPPEQRLAQLRPGDGGNGRKVPGVATVVRRPETGAKDLFDGSSESISVTGADPGIDAVMKQKHTDRQPIRGVMGKLVEHTG
ncbi:hypothetical protein ACIBSV_42795 [Embleya sp. NPDC050154]|uniref:hypothetical protein n=1 Tax=unclassified Embleya TaxID=2699296 RepID=UPI0037B951DC